MSQKFVNEVITTKRKLKNVEELIEIRIKDAIVRGADSETRI